MIQHSLHHALLHHPGRLLVILSGDILQRLKPFIRICRHSAKRRRIQIPKSGGTRDPAGKGIFIHSGIQRHLHMLDLSGCMLLCTGYSKCNSSRLRHAKRRLHILPDQSGQFFHLSPAFPKIPNAFMCDHYTTCAGKEATRKRHLLPKPWIAGIIPAQQGGPACRPGSHLCDHYTTSPPGKKLYIFFIASLLTFPLQAL